MPKCLLILKLAHQPDMAIKANKMLKFENCDFTIFSKIDGVVEFSFAKRNKKQINIVPIPTS